MSKLIVIAITYAVVVSVVMAVTHLLIDGELELIPSVVGGLVFGITVAIFSHWKSKKSPASDNGESE